MDNRELDLEYAKFFQSLGFDQNQISMAMHALEINASLSKAISSAIRRNWLTKDKI